MITSLQTTTRPEQRQHNKSRDSANK